MKKISTSNLINQSDIVILNGGSSFFEASIIGKPILSLASLFMMLQNTNTISTAFHTLTI